MTSSSDDYVYSLDLHFDPFVHLHQKLSQRSMTLSESDRFQLVENYVEHIVDGMDTDSLAAMVVDLLTREYENLTEDQIKEEIVDLYDEETLEDLMPS